MLHAVEDANVNGSGEDSLHRAAREWAVRAVGRVQTVDELRTTVVAVKERVPVMLGDIADVVEAPAVRRGVAHRLGGRSRELSCRQAVRCGYRRRLRPPFARRSLDIGRSLPDGVTLRMVYDQSDLVEQRTRWREPRHPDRRRSRRRRAVRPARQLAGGTAR